MSEQLLSDALRCDYCGGFIDPDTYKCPYCDTQYSKPVNNLTDLFHQKTVVKSAPCEVFDIRKKVNAYDLRVDRALKILKELSEDLTTGLIDIYEPEGGADEIVVEALEAAIAALEEKERHE